MNVFRRACLATPDNVLFVPIYPHVDNRLLEALDSQDERARYPELMQLYEEYADTSPIC